TKGTKENTKKPLFFVSFLCALCAFVVNLRPSVRIASGGTAMSAVPKRLLTREEYLAQERKAPFRSEYYRGEVFARAGASYIHCLITDNLSGELRERFKDGPCRAITSNLRVKVDATG